MNEYNDNNQYEESEGISLQQLTTILWNNILMIFIITFLVTALGVLYTFALVTPKYTAQTSLIVQVDLETSQTNEQSAIVIANNLIGTYEEFIVSDKVLDSVKEDIPELVNVSLSSIRNSISVSTTSQVLLIHISVVSESPELAQKLANTIVNNSIEIANDENSPYVFLQNKLKVLDEAKLPEEPSSPNKFLNIVISVLLGGIFSLAVVFVKEFFNNKFKSAQELENYLQVKVIGAIPSLAKAKRQVD